MQVTQVVQVLINSATLILLLITHSRYVDFLGKTAQYRCPKIKPAMQGALFGRKQKFGLTPYVLTLTATLTQPSIFKCQCLQSLMAARRMRADASRKYLRAALLSRPLHRRPRCVHCCKWSVFCSSDETQRRMSENNLRPRTRARVPTASENKFRGARRHR